ncbi:MAG TPA: hypothetical protein VIO81_12145 [Methyloversatilis sp.]
MRHGQASASVQAAWVALALLLCFELALHSDAMLQRYRAVFAVGRAVDKIAYVERTRPALLILGNSRADNGIVPTTMLGSADIHAFNLGMPGANALVLQGVTERLLARDAPAPTDVFITLDETLFQHEDSLGYYGFLASRETLFKGGFNAELFGSLLRTWYYAGNLRQLREPDKLLRFVQATIGDIDPIGGSATQTLGYRAGFKGRFQNRAQLMAQEAGTRAPPDPRMVEALLTAIDRFHRAGTQVHLIATPLFGRASAFRPDAAPGPYADLMPLLEARGGRWLAVPHTELDADHFADPGHLNDSGAQLYSAALGQAWRNLKQ